jgi:hypothetical protein
MNVLTVSPSEWVNYPTDPELVGYVDSLAGIVTGYMNAPVALGAWSTAIMAKVTIVKNFQDFHDWLAKTTVAGEVPIYLYALEKLPESKLCVRYAIDVKTDDQS